MKKIGMLLLVVLCLCVCAKEPFQYPDWVTEEMKEYIPEMELRGMIVACKRIILKRTAESQSKEDAELLSKQLEEGYKELIQKKTEMYKKDPEKLKRYQDYYAKLDIDIEDVDYEKAPHPPWVTGEMKEKIPLSQLQMDYKTYYSGVDIIEQMLIDLLKPENKKQLEACQRAAKHQNEFRYRTMQIIAMEKEVPEQFIYLMPNADDYFDYWARGAGADFGPRGSDVQFTLNPRFESVVMTILSREKAIAMPQVDWERNLKWANVSWLNRCKIGAIICVIYEIEGRATGGKKSKGGPFFGSDLEDIPDDMEVVGRLIREMIRIATFSETRNQAEYLAKELCYLALKKWKDQEWKWEKPKELLELDFENRKPTPHPHRNDFWPKRPEKPYQDETWLKRRPVQPSVTGNIIQNGNKRKDAKNIPSR